MTRPYLSYVGLWPLLACACCGSMAMAVWMGLLHVHAMRGAVRWRAAVGLLVAVSRVRAVPVAKRVEALLGCRLASDESLSRNHS